MLLLLLTKKNLGGQLLETLNLLNGKINLRRSSKFLIGGNGWTRTNHTQIFSLLLYLMSYRGNNLVDVSGIEPLTYSVSSCCTTAVLNIQCGEL